MSKKESSEVVAVLQDPESASSRVTGLINGPRARPAFNLDLELYLDLELFWTDPGFFYILTCLQNLECLFGRVLINAALCLEIFSELIESAKVWSEVWTRYGAQMNFKIKK